MTKQEIVSKIAAATGLTKVDAEAAVDQFTETVIGAMKTGLSIELREFGTFKLKERSARTARNPRTGEKVQVPAKHVPVFKFSRSVRDAIMKGPADGTATE